jgi:hypothetical protein
MLSFFTASTIAELICFLFAVICLSEKTVWAWKSQIFYLAITCITEFAGIYVSHHKYSNQWVYNIFILFEAGFTFLMFAHLLKRYIDSKSVIICGLAIFLALYIYEIANKSFFVYVYPAYTVLSVLFVFYSLYYYYLMLNDEHYIYLKYSAEFWWVAGTLFFYFGNTACDMFDDKLSGVMIEPFHQHLTYFIYKALNIILYGCWSYSFICKKWLTRTLER